MERPQLAEKALEPSDWSSFDRNPSYLQMVGHVYTAFTTEWSNWRTPGFFVTDFVDDLRNYSAVTVDDLLAVLIVAIAFTLLRSQLTEWAFKPLANWLQLRKADAHKFPESMFKGMYYTASFTYAGYILFWMGGDYFGDQSYPFADWAARMPIPRETYGLYIMQLGFYVHAMYGVLVLDARRKDTFVMVLHHVLTLLLVGFSFAIRVQRIGTLVMFLHDNADIFLEAGKLMMMFRHRGKKFDRISDHLSTFCFIMFLASWLILRLVVYIRVVLYSSAHVVLIVIPSPPFYIFFNFLLFSLYVMNVWWFQFIVLVAVRIVSGTHVKDTREDTSEEDGSIDSDGDALAMSSGARHGNGATDDAEEDKQMHLQRLLRLPMNKAPANEVAATDLASGKDVTELAPGQSASQTANRRLRSRQS